MAGERRPGRRARETRGARGASGAPKLIALVDAVAREDAEDALHVPQLAARVPLGPSVATTTVAALFERLAQVLAQAERLGMLASPERRAERLCMLGKVVEKVRRDLHAREARVVDRAERLELGGAPVGHARELDGPPLRERCAVLPHRRHLAPPLVPRVGRRTRRRRRRLDVCPFDVDETRVEGLLVEVGVAQRGQHGAHVVAQHVEHHLHL